jgi:two-component system chemotaxis sensor kinase CheA
MNAPAAPRRFVSIGLKLTSLIVLVLAPITALTYVGISAHQRQTLMTGKQTAARMVVDLFAVNAAPALVFADQDEMDRSVRDLGRNPEVTRANLFAFPEGEGEGQGHVPARNAAQLARDEATPLSAPRSIAASDGIVDGRLRVDRPVRGPDGALVGIASVEFSLDRENAAIAAGSRRVLLISVALASLISVILTLSMRRLVVAPLRALGAAAASLARGQRARIEVRAEDEVGRLARAFDGMAAAIAEREERIAQRNRDLKLILDNVGQGFLSTDGAGAVASEWSGVVSTWLPAIAASAKLWDVIGSFDRAAGEWLEISWEQLADPDLPLELGLAQMPVRFTDGRRHLDVAYRPVVEQIDGTERLRQLVVILTDVTTAVARERDERAQKDFLALLARVVHDRAGAAEFHAEAAAIVERIVLGGHRVELLRDLHTLKGNSRFFGLQGIADLCHELETTIQEHGDLDQEDRDRLAASWNVVDAKVGPLLSARSAFLELSESDFRSVADAVKHRVRHEQLAVILSELRYESTRRRFERARDQIAAVAKKLGKPEPEVTIEDHGLRLPPARWASFWSAFAHVAANVADHALPTFDERPTPTSIVLRSVVVSGELIVEVVDRGRGIDWDLVRRKAEARGLPSRTHQDLVAALFADGLSTRDCVSATSGRGVGLAAVAAAVRDLGGVIEVDSVRTPESSGTTMRFRVPTTAMREPLRPSMRPTAVSSAPPQ